MVRGCVCVCVCARAYVLCRSHAVFIETRSFPVLIHVTAMRSKKCHLTDKEVTCFNISVEKGTREIKVLMDKGKGERE